MCLSDCTFHLTLKRRSKAYYVSSRRKSVSALFYNLRRSRKLSALFCVITVFILVDSKIYFLVRLCIVPGSEEEECTCIGKNHLYVHSIPCNVNTFHYFSPLNQFAKLSLLSSKEVKKSRTRSYRLATLTELLLEAV